MNLKRVLSLFLLATLSLFVLSACSDDSGDSNSDNRGSSNTLDGVIIGTEDNGNSNPNNDNNNSDSGSSDATDGDDATGNSGDDVIDENTDDDSDDNTDSSEEDQYSESYYQFKIASAFYNAASKLSNAALTYETTFDSSSYKSTVDIENLTGAKEDFKEAYELIKEYIATYELTQQNDAWNSTDNFYCSSLEGCLAEIDKGFANLESIVLEEYAYYYTRPTIKAYMDNLTNEVVIPMYLYLYSYNESESDYLLTAKYSQEAAYQLYTIYMNAYAVNASYYAANVQSSFYKAQIYFSKIDSSVFEEEEDATDTDTDTGTDTEGTGTTDTEDDGTINNTFSVEQLDVLFLDAFDEEITGSSLNGVDEDYYFNSVRLALSYNESTNELTVLGKFEITWEDMTDMAKVNLNELRYRRIYDNLTIDSATFNSMLTQDGDTYTFVYPFSLGFNGTVYYNDNSSYKLTFTLKKDGAFPSEENIESFVAKERELIPLNLAGDPYSIYGSYQVDNCTGYVGTTSSNTNSWVNQSYDLTIKNAWFTLYNVGSLTVNFEVSGYEWEGTDLGYNGTVNFIKHWKNDGEENLWWKRVDSDGYGYFEYSTNNDMYGVTVRDNEDGSLEVYHAIIDSYKNGYLWEFASFTCKFVKISDQKITE